ncbi:MAG: S-layer homology domain-containing protein [Cyanobacteria bacterium P01_D01_bin.36]
MKISLVQVVFSLCLLIAVAGCDIAEKSAVDNQSETLASSSETASESVEALADETPETEGDEQQNGNADSGETADFEAPAGFEASPSPNKEMIADLIELGVFEEIQAVYEDFDLLEPMTRGQYLMLLYHASNSVRPSKNHIRLAPSAEVSFSDIESSHPAYKYVQAFENTGYSVGYEEGTFKPDQPITREEMIAIKVPVDGYQLIETIWSQFDDFNDADQINPDFVNYVYNDMRAQESDGNNVSRAFGAVKSFKPKEPVLGYEAAATLWEFKVDRSYQSAPDALERIAREAE